MRIQVKTRMYYLNREGVLQVTEETKPIVAAAIPITQPKPQRKLAGMLASQWSTQTRETVLIAGMPKGAGKTTLALSPLIGRPSARAVVIACDLGKLSIPEGIDRTTQVLVLPNQGLTREMDGKGFSKPVKDIYLKLTGDLFEIYRSISEDRALQLENGTEFAPPQYIVLDGMSRLNTMLVDGQCAMNGLDDPSDLDNKAYKFWGKRLRNTLTIVEQFASLPATVIMTTWVDSQKDSDGKPTGVWLPDIGGKMDLLTAGTVGAALYAYSKFDLVTKMTRYYVQTQADTPHPWCGVRDRYSLPKEIDVTLTGKPGEAMPWHRIFKETV
jgi:hypothetical protein